MITPRDTDSPQRSRGYEPPAQPSSLPSSTATDAAPAATVNAEPIPTDELPAASPLLDDRPERGRAASKRLWWPLGLLLAVLVALIVAAAVSPRAGRGVRGSDEMSSPGEAPLEKMAPASPQAR